MRSWYRPLLAVAALVPLAGVAHAQIVFSDDFNADTQALATTTLLNWNVTRDNVDVIGDSFFDFYPGNGNYIDMGGSSGYGRIETSSLSLLAGDYTLSFDLGKNGGGLRTMGVDVGSAFSETLSDSDDYPSLVNISRTFTIGADTLGVLSFDFPQVAGNPANQGYVIDNVRLVRTATSVPEPAALALAALGLGTLALSRRRRT